VSGIGVGWNTSSLKPSSGFGPSCKGGKSVRKRVMPMDDQHITLLLNYAKGLYQGVCTCGWSSTIGAFEEADLLRAMHAHAVVTFQSYR
jgi:hypothetical protein